MIGSSTHCSQCGLDFSVHIPVASLCPNCGLSFSSVSSSSVVEEHAEVLRSSASFELIRDFFKTTKELIFSPGAFFSKHASEIPGEGKFSISSVLAYSLLVQWLAAFVFFLWFYFFGSALESRFSDFFSSNMDFRAQIVWVQLFEQMKGQVFNFLFGALGIVVTPFTALMQLLFYSLISHIGVLCFVPKKQNPTYSTTLKIRALSFAPICLSIIPGLGHFMAWCLEYVCQVAGYKEVYKVTTTRAVLITFFPFLIGLGLFLLGFTVFLLVAFKFLHFLF